MIDPKVPPSLDRAAEMTHEFVLRLRACEDLTWAPTVLPAALRSHFDDFVAWAKWGVNIYTARGRRALPHSRAASAASSATRREHAVPMKVIVRACLEAGSTADIRRAIDAYTLAVITTEEDRRLTAAGLRDRMPEGWTIGADPFARYGEVGIKMVETTEA